MIACYLALALGPSLPLIVLIRLVAGAGEAAFAIAILTAAADLAPADRRGEAISLVTTASYLGLTIGPVAADFILGGDRFGLSWVVAASFVVLGTRCRDPARRDAAGVRARGSRWLAAAANGPPPRSARADCAPRLRRIRRLRRALRAGARLRPARAHLRAVRLGRRPRPHLRPEASRPARGSADARALLRQPRPRAGDDRRLAVRDGPARRHGDLRGRPGALVPGGGAPGDGDLQRGGAERRRRGRDRVRRRRPQPGSVHARRRRRRHRVRRRVSRFLGRRAQRAAAWLRRGGDPRRIALEEAAP